MVVCEKIYLASQINNQYIYLKNNIEQLYFILGRVELHWSFCSIPDDGSDIYTIPTGSVFYHVLCWKSLNIKGILK